MEYPEFLVIDNIKEYNNEFLFHTRKPRAIYRIIENDRKFYFELVDEIDNFSEYPETTVKDLVNRMADWWLDYLETHENGGEYIG